MTNPGPWSAEPPCWAIPVTVACDVSLFCTNGIFAWVGAFTAYPTGYAFSLVVGSYGSDPPLQNLSFDVVREDDRQAITWLQLRSSKGWATDSIAPQLRQPPLGEPVLVAYDEANVRAPGSNATSRHESRWWVSPLPAADETIEIEIFLPGAIQPNGAGKLETLAIRRAAADAPVLWPQAGQ